MTTSSAIVNRVTPTNHYKNEGRLSSHAVETHSSFFETAGRYAVNTAAITTAIALPALAIANGIGVFSSGQDTYTQDPTALGRNYTMTSPMVETSSACVQNVVLGLFGTLLTQSSWPTLAGLFSCLSGAAAQTSPSSGSGSSISNPVLTCNNTNPITYTIGQASPFVVDDTITVRDPFTNDRLANSSATFFIDGPCVAASFGYLDVAGLHVSTSLTTPALGSGSSQTPGSMTYVITAVPTDVGPFGRVASVLSFQQFLRGISVSNVVQGSCLATFDVKDLNNRLDECTYNLNFVAPPSTPVPGSGSGQTLAPLTTQAPGSGSGSSNPVLTCNNATPLTYYVGQESNPVLPFFVDRNFVIDSSNGVLNALAYIVQKAPCLDISISACNDYPGSTTFPCLSLDVNTLYTPVNGGTDIALVATTAHNILPTTTSDFSGFLAGITFSSSSLAPASCPVEFVVTDDHNDKTNCVYTVNIVPATPAPPASGSSSDNPTMPPLPPITLVPGSGSSGGSSSFSNSSASSNTDAIVGGSVVGGLVATTALIQCFRNWLKNRKKPEDPEVDSTRASMHVVVAPSTDYKPFKELQSEQKFPGESGVTEQT